MAQNNRTRNGPFAGLPQGAADLAAAALKYGDEWGGKLGRQVVEAAKQAARAHQEGRELEGRGLMLRSSKDAAGKLNAVPVTAAGLVWGGLAGLADPNVRQGWGNNAVQFTDVRPPFMAPNAAMTLGNVQLFSPQKGPTHEIVSPYTRQRMLAGDHEEHHTNRGQELGLAFGPLWVAGGGLSNKNPEEIAADKYGAEKFRRRTAGR